MEPVNLASTAIDPDSLAAINEIMDFLIFSHKKTSAYKGAVRFSFSAPGARESMVRVVEVRKECVRVYRGDAPPDVEITCRVTINANDFITVYSGKATAAEITKMCLGGRIWVHGMAFKNLNGFASSFDFTTEKWDNFYALREYFTSPPPQCTHENIFLDSLDGEPSSADSVVRVSPPAAFGCDHDSSFDEISRATGRLGTSSDLNVSCTPILSCAAEESDRNRLLNPSKRTTAALSSERNSLPAGGDSILDSFHIDLNFGKINSMYHIPLTTVPCVYDPVACWRVFFSDFLPEYSSKLGYGAVAEFDQPSSDLPNSRLKQPPIVSVPQQHLPRLDCHQFPANVALGSSARGPAGGLVVPSPFYYAAACIHGFPLPRGRIRTSTSLRLSVLPSGVEANVIGAMQTLPGRLEAIFSRFREPLLSSLLRVTNDSNDFPPWL
jgi:hypothetical protein